MLSRGTSTDLFDHWSGKNDLNLTHGGGAGRTLALDSKQKFTVARGSA